MDLVYFPDADIVVSLGSISSIRFFAPRDLTLDFPEVKTKKPRRRRTSWKALLKMDSGEEILLAGDEAENFFESIKKNIGVFNEKPKQQ